MISGYSMAYSGLFLKKLHQTKKSLLPDIKDYKVLLISYTYQHALFWVFWRMWKVLANPNLYENFQER